MAARGDIVSTGLRIIEAFEGDILQKTGCQD